MSKETYEMIKDAGKPMWVTPVGVDKDKLMAYLKEMKDHYERTGANSISNIQIDWLKGNNHAITMILDALEKGIFE